MSTYFSKYTGAEVEELLDKVNEGGGGSGYDYWNYYLFEGGSGDSVVTIDGVDVTVPANTIVEGNFTTDITAIPFSTNNLKRIVIRGDVSLTLGDEAEENTTVETIDMEFSQGFARSFGDMFSNLCNVISLRIRGGIATSAEGMFFGVGYYADCGAMIDFSGVDFSQCSNFDYAFAYVVTQSINLSEHTFLSNPSWEMLLLNAIVGTVDLSGMNLTTVKPDSSGYILGAAAVNSYHFNGMVLPTNSSDNYNFIRYLLYSYLADTQIDGSFGTILGRTINFTTAKQIGLTTMLSVIGALEQGGGGTLQISTAAWTGLGQSSIIEELVADKGWTLTIG